MLRINITKWFNKDKKMSEIQEVNAQQAKEMLDNNDAVMIDVREQGEYDMMHIENCKLLAQSSFEVSQLPDLADKKLIVICRSGARSAAVCRKIMQETDIIPYNLVGGIMAWHYSGFPVIEE